MFPLPFSFCYIFTFTGYNQWISNFLSQMLSTFYAAIYLRLIIRHCCLKYCVILGVNLIKILCVYFMILRLSYSKLNITR
jgi:hypothetical protein